MSLFSKHKNKIFTPASCRKSYNGWIKCPGCHELIHEHELSQNLECCPKCDYHHHFKLSKWLDLLVDPNSSTDLFENITSKDPLNFIDTKPYKQRLEEASLKNGKHDALKCVRCTLGGLEIILTIMDFNFMAGSMGSVVGEKLTLAIELSLEQKLPLVTICCSGGARMQESIHSLMQMAKTSAALGKLHVASIPYLVVLTNPTTGGVTASFAALGDITFAEPQALICFAGPRVIQQTIGKPLPPQAQRSEFLLEHGMIDAVVKRKDLKNKIFQSLSLLKK